MCEGRLDTETLCELENHLESCESCSSKVGEILSSLQQGVVRKFDDFGSDLLVKGMLRTGGAGLRPTIRASGQEGDLGRLGRYRLLEMIGEGTSSVVYRGMDNLLLRPVIVKAFRPGYCSGEEGKRELLEEARIVARFGNDLVTGLLDLGKDCGTSFLVFPYSNGVSLDGLLPNPSAVEGKTTTKMMSLLDNLRLAHDLARGLAEIHRQGLLHRDIKPANVVIHVDGDGNKRSRLIDLGLACNRSSKVGTPAYRAPELEAGGIHSISTDLYSFGQLLQDLQKLSLKRWPRGLRTICSGLTEENPIFRPSLPQVETALRTAVKREDRSWLQGAVWAGLWLLSGLAIGAIFCLVLIWSPRP